MKELKRATLATTVTLFAFATTINGQESIATEQTNIVDTLAQEQPSRSIASFQNHLTQTADSITMGCATFREDNAAQSAIAIYEAQRTSAYIDGYRVGVYFNNSAQARSGAIEVVRRCDSLLSDIPSTMSYDNPYFKVSVGYCTNEEEAVIMLNRVQRYFPKAYLMRERISVENIIASRAQEVKSQEIKSKDE